MIVNDLKKSIIDYAMHGKLIKNDTSLLKPNVTSTLKDMPYELPDNWIFCKLEDVVVLTSGNTLSIEHEKGDYPYLKVADMNLPENSFKIVTSSRFLNKDEVKNIVPLNSIIFPKRGGAIFTNKKKLVLDCEICVDLNTMAMTPKTQLNIMFLYYWFYNIDLKSLNNGSAVPQVNNKDLYPLAFPLPPLEEQLKIVDKIETLFSELDKIIPIEDELISLKKCISDKLKYSIVDSAIRGKLLKNNSKINPVFDKNLYTKDLPYEIPSNWCWVKLGDVLDIKTGIGYKKTDQCDSSKGELRVLRGGNINNNYQYELKDDDVYVRNIDKYYELAKNDIITPSVTSMEQMVKVAFIDKDLNKTTAGGFVYIIKSIDEKVLSPKYALYFLSSKFHKEMCKPNIHKSGQAFYNLKKSGLTEQPIPLPPLEEQLRIVDKIELLLNLCNDISKIVNN